MANRKKRTKKDIEKIIEVMAGYGCSQKLIASTIPELRNSDLEKKGAYRKSWELGREKAHLGVLGAYYKAASGKGYKGVWNATKHYLAIHCNMIEPKVPEVVHHHYDSIKIIDDMGSIHGKNSEG